MASRRLEMLSSALRSPKHATHQRRAVVHSQRTSSAASSFKMVFMEAGGVVPGGRVALCATHVQQAYPADKVSVALADVSPQAVCRCLR